MNLNRTLTIILLCLFSCRKSEIRSHSEFYKSFIERSKYISKEYPNLSFVKRNNFYYISSNDNNDSLKEFSLKCGNIEYNIRSKKDSILIDGFCYSIEKSIIGILKNQTNYSISTFYFLDKYKVINYSNRNSFYEVYGDKILLNDGFWALVEY